MSKEYIENSYEYFKNSRNGKWKTGNDDTSEESNGLDTVCITLQTLISVIVCQFKISH